MDSNDRTVGIIATVAAVLLCGLPGLLGLCVGALTAVVSFMPGAEIDMLGRNDPGAALTFGLVTLCFSVLFVLIPILVGYYTLRRRSAVVTPISPVTPTSPPPPPPAVDVYTAPPETPLEESEPHDEEDIPPAI